jgi:hypothetical protein
VFLCFLCVRLVCELALLGRTVPLPLLDCPASKPWLPGAVDPLVAVNDRFVFPSVRRAAPRPRLLLVLPTCPTHPLPRVDIWSMKELCNLNYDAGDVFEEFFH